MMMCQMPILCSIRSDVRMTMNGELGEMIKAMIMPGGCEAENRKLQSRLPVCQLVFEKAPKYKSGTYAQYLRSEMLISTYKLVYYIPIILFLQTFLVRPFQIIRHNLFE